MRPSPRRPDEAVRDAPLLTDELQRRGRWRRPADTLECTRQGLVWTTDGRRSAIPWEAVTSAAAVGGRLEVGYRWPYAADGCAAMTFRLEPMMAYLVYEAIQRRMAVRSLPTPREGI